MYDEVVVKGARLWSMWNENFTRATGDLDYSVQQAGLRCPDKSEADQYGQKIINSLSQDIEDGLTFDSNSFRSSFHEGKLGSSAINGSAMLYTAKIPVKIEVGFGHQIPPMAIQQLNWKPILPKGLGGFRLNAYSPEMWLAEKIRIVFEYGRDNSRLKDYFDMHLLFQKDLSNSLLKECLQATCQDFEIALPHDFAEAPGFSKEFAERNSDIWQRKRWREWTGKDFNPQQDPTLHQVIEGIIEKSRSLQLNEINDVITSFKI